MRRRYLRWLPVVIVLAVTVITATVWAKTIHSTEPVLFFNVDSQGSIQTIGSTTAQITISVNDKTFAYHGTAHAKVTNLSGHNVTFSDSGVDFGLGGIRKSKYTVKANGDATLTVSGVLSP